MRGGPHAAALFGWALLTLLLLAAQGAQAQQPGAPRDPAHAGPAEPPSDATLASREAWAATRLFEVKTERRELIVSGRPDYFRRRRALGFAAMGVGAGITAITGMAVLLTVTSHTSDGSLTDPQRRAFWGGIGTGMGTLVAGLGALLSLRRDNANQGRIDTLDEELTALHKELRLLRGEQRERARYGLLPSVSPRAAMLSLRMVW